MNQSSDAAEQIVRMSLEGFQVAAKITGSGTKNIAVGLYAVLKSKEQTSGKTKLTNMLKSGKPLTVFSVKNTDLKKFQEEAKRYGILYCALIDKKGKSPDGLIDIVVRKEDAGRINRIVERFQFASYNKADIISDIEKTRGEKAREKVHQNKDNGKSKSKKNKEDNYLNPHLAKTEKSPLSKPICEMPKSSTREGDMISGKKASIKEKLNEYIKQHKESESKNKNKNINKNKVPNNHIKKSKNKGKTL